MELEPFYLILDQWPSIKIVSPSAGYTLAFIGNLKTPQFLHLQMILLLMKSNWMNLSETFLIIFLTLDTIDSIHKNLTKDFQKWCCFPLTISVLNYLVLSHQSRQKTNKSRTAFRLLPQDRWPLGSGGHGYIITIGHLAFLRVLFGSVLHGIQILFLGFAIFAEYGHANANANGLYCWPEPSPLHCRIILNVTNTCVPALPNSVGNIIENRGTRITYPQTSPCKIWKVTK